MFVYELKWDNTNQFFPFRYFIDTIISEGAFPLWNPYINLGYPIYGDPQGGVWYPFTWLNSLLGGYSFRSFNFEVWLHYVFAGIGMYRVGQALRTNNAVAFCMGLTYMFCGFFVGTSQVYPWIIGAAWFPFIVADLIRINREFSWFLIMRMALFISLTVLGAYPAFLIVLFYIFLLFFIRKLLQSRKEIALVKRWLLGACGMLLVILLLCSGYLISLVETFSFISRAEALDYSDYFYYTSFTFQAAISLLYPFATTVESVWFNSDMSMLNGYVGAMTIPFIIYSVVKIKDRRIWWLLAGIVIFFLASTGAQTPIRFWLYQFLPGFDMFRHPSILRVFFMFGLIILFGKGLQHFIEQGALTKNIRIYYLVLFIGVLIGLVISWRIFDTAQLMPLLKFYWDNQFPSLFPISGHVFVQSMILSILLGTFVIFLFLRNNVRFIWVFAPLLFIDLFLATQLNIPTTVMDPTELKVADELLAQMPESLTGQSLDEHLINIDDTHAVITIPGTWRNKSMFTKRTAFGGYNPYQLRDCTELERSVLWQASIDVPLLFLSNALSQPDRIDTNARVLNVQQAVFDRYKKVGADPIKSKIRSFQIGTNSFSVEYHSEEDQFMALVQNHMPNWKVFVDGNESELIQYNGTLMAVQAPKGEHQIEFKYSAPWIVRLFALNTMGLLVLLAFLILRPLNGAKTRHLK